MQELVQIQEEMFPTAEATKVEDPKKMASVRKKLNECYRHLNDMTTNDSMPFHVIKAVNKAATDLLRSVN